MQPPPLCGMSHELNYSRPQQAVRCTYCRRDHSTTDNNAGQPLTVAMYGVGNAVQARKVADDFLSAAVVHGQRLQLVIREVRTGCAVEFSGIAVIIVFVDNSRRRRPGAAHGRRRGGGRGNDRGGQAYGGLGIVRCRSRRFVRVGAGGAGGAITAATADLAEAKI